jgi:hypothetical protein
MSFRVESFFCFAQLPTLTAPRSSISGLTTKRLTSTLYDIIYYFVRPSKKCKFFYLFGFIKYVFCVKKSAVPCHFLTQL